MTVTFRHRANFSKQHYWAAEYFAKQSTSIEQSGTKPTEELRKEHRALVTSAIMSSIAFLEASINEFYVSALEPNTRMQFGIDDCAGRLFQHDWDTNDRQSLLQKYQNALKFTNHAQFETGRSQYQNTTALMKLRNALIHFKSEWHDENGNHKRLQRSLQGKFALNQWAPEGSLWFPHRCLGAGCAKWSVKTAQEFSDAFTNLLGIPSRVQ